MRLLKKRGPFSTIDIFLEDVSLNEVLSLMRMFDRVSILLHHPMALPDGFRLRQKKTPNIYLDKPWEEVFGAFRDTVRNEIRRTERLSECVFRCPDHDKKTVYPLYSEFEFAQGRAPISYQDFAVYECATALYKGEVVSGITFFESENVIRIRSIFSKRLTAKNRDPGLYKIIGFASKRLVQEICLYGKARGVRCVDLASINLTDPEKESIARFKSGFGARIEDEYQYVWTSRVFVFAQVFLTSWVWLRKAMHKIMRVFLR